MPPRGVTELTVLAPDHPRLLSIIAGACAVAGANIVDAQIFTTTDGLALDTIAVIARVRHATRTSSARARSRIADADREGAARRTASCPTWWRSASPPKAPPEGVRASSRTSTINNQWSNRYTVVEVTGLDRPGPALRTDRDACRSSTSTSATEVMLRAGFDNVAAGPAGRGQALDHGSGLRLPGC